MNEYVTIEIPVMTIQYERVTLIKYLSDIANFHFSKSNVYTEKYYKVPLGMEYILLTTEYPDGHDEDVAILVMTEIIDFQSNRQRMREYVIANMNNLIFVGDLEEEE